MSVTPSTLNLSLDGRLVVIQQQDVAKVYQGEKGSRFSSALIGARLGAGIGIGIAAVYIYTTKGDSLIGAAGLLAFLPVQSWVD